MTIAFMGALPWREHSTRILGCDSNLGQIPETVDRQQCLASARSIRPASDRALALDGDARARARMRPVIPHRAVLRAAIVPEGDRVLGPAEAALEQRVLRVLIKI